MVYSTMVPPTTTWKPLYNPRIRIAFCTVGGILRNDYRHLIRKTEDISNALLCILQPHAVPAERYGMATTKYATPTVPI